MLDLVDQFRVNACWFYSGWQWRGWWAAEMQMFRDAYLMYTPADRRRGDGKEHTMPSGSGWGTDDARGDWYANRDFNLRNLQVSKGDKLPPQWGQVPDNRRYLLDHFGADCIVKKESAAKRGAKKAAATAGAKTGK